MLDFWRPEDSIDDATRQRWLRAGERVATGLRVLAHLDAFTDVRRLTVGFSLAGDENLAERYVKAIRDEHIDARLSSPIDDRTHDADAGRRGLLSAARRLLAGNLARDEVLLPCRPDATDEEIKHVVLAALKASHALQYGLPLASDELGELRQ